MPPRTAPRILFQRKHSRLLPLAALALVLGLMSLVALAAVVALPGAAPPRAHAAGAARSSGDGTVLVSPAAAGPDTSLTLQIRIYSDTGSSYELRYTTADPAQGGCSGAQPVPVSGLNPFTLTSQPTPGTLTFTWPSILGSDQYYFCVYRTASSTQTPDATAAAAATPTSPAQYSTGESAHSIAPFTETRDASPQISVTLPGSTTPTTNNIPLASPFSVTVSDWKTPQGTCPTHLWLLFPDNISRAELPFSVTSPLNANRQCVLQTSATAAPGSPITISPGQYTLLAGDTSIYQESAPLTFVTAPASTATAGGSPTVPATPPAVTPHTVASTGLSPLVYVLSALALLIALGLVAVVVVLALRGRSETRQQEMRQMGLDVESLESGEPVAVRPTVRPGQRERGDASWQHERRDDDEWLPPTRPTRPPTYPPEPQW